MPGGIKLKRPEKRKIVTMLLAVLLIAALTGCGKEEDITEPETGEEEKTYTSEMLGLYAAEKDGKKTVVDASGTVNPDFFIDEQGNICGKEGEIKIKNTDVTEYIYVTSLIPMTAEGSIQVELEQSIRSGTIKQIDTEEKVIEFRVYLGPSDSFNRTVEISSTDSSVAMPAEDIQAAVMSNPIYANPKDSVISVFLLCRKEGSALISIKATDGGGAETEMEVTVTQKKIEPAVIQTSSEELIATTENTAAWISQNTDIAVLYEKPGDAADALLYCGKGKDITVLGRSGEWVKCSVNGVTGYIKKEYVTATDPNEATATGTTQVPAETPEPPASNDGLDHGLALGAENEGDISSRLETANEETHTHYYVKYRVVEPSATEQGYTIYMCECGSYYRTNYTEKTGK